MGAGTDAAVKRGHPILFGSIVLFSIIQMSITAWLTAQYNANHNEPSDSVRTRVRYILFCSIWTILGGSFYLVSFRMLPGVVSSVASHFIFLFVTFILWVAAAASITESLGGGLSCSAENVWAYCGQLNAVEGFAWLIWILVTFTLIMVIVRGIAGARKGEGYGTGLVAGGSDV